MPATRNYFPYLALAAGILWLGFSAIFVRWANVPGPVMGVYRLGIASLVMAPVFLWRRRGKAQLTKWVLVSQVLGYLAVAYALGHLPASIVAPTLIGQPVVTALLSIPFLGEVLAPAQWLGGIGVLAGIYLVHHSRMESTAIPNEEVLLT
jgi:drug/metabolite transporter (DMT)-like permease